MRLKVRPALANRPGCTVAGSRPLRPRVRHSLRTKLAHEGLEMGARDQPLLLCDDVGEDLLPALSHLGREETWTWRNPTWSHVGVQGRRSAPQHAAATPRTGPRPACVTVSACIAYLRTYLLTNLLTCLLRTGPHPAAPSHLVLTACSHLGTHPVLLPRVRSACYLLLATSHAPRPTAHAPPRARSERGRARRAFPPARRAPGEM